MTKIRLRQIFRYFWMARRVENMAIPKPKRRGTKNMRERNVILSGQTVIWAT